MEGAKPVMGARVRCSVRRDRCFLSRPLRLNGHDAKADVVVTPLRLEPQSKGRPARPALVGPAAAPAHPGDVAVFAFRCRGLRGIQVGIGAARQLRVIPVPAPLEGVAVHVVQAPGVGGVAADLGGPIERRPRLGPVVRLALEVRLLAAELVAERGGRRRPGPAGVFPLRFGGQPELPILREVAGLAAELGELLAERLRLGEVDVAHREVVPLGQLRRQLARQLSDDPLPLPLRRLVLAHPEAFGQRHLDLILARAPLGFAGRAAHREPARRAPAELDAGDLAFVPGL